MIDKGGKRIVYYKYDSWGNTVSISGSLAESVGKKNPFRYRGYYYDAESGLYYLQSRYYDPEIRRFISADETEELKADYENPAQYNLYSYCFANSVNMADENGGWPSWATKVAVGIGAVIIGAAVVAATAATVGAAGAFVGATAAGLKAAAVSGAIGSVFGAGISVVSHVVSTGSWSGAGNAAVSGAIDGFSNGFMTGGIMSGVTNAALASKGIYVNKIGMLHPDSKQGNGYPGIRYGVKKQAEIFLIDL